MRQDRLPRGIRRGRKGFERVLDELHRDRQELRRLERALRRYVEEDPACRNRRGYLELVTWMAKDLATTIEDVRAARDRATADSIVHPRFLAERRRRRRDWRRVHRALPDDLFAGVPVESAEQDARRIARIEARAVPEEPDAESALLLLPTSWLRAIGGRHGTVSGASRSCLAATCAFPLYQPRYLEAFLDREVEPAHLGFLAHVVAAGKIALGDLAPAERTALEVELDWRAPAAGVGARLRQLGLVFVGAESGRRTVYVPEGARPSLALALVRLLREQGRPGDPRQVEQLVALSQAAARRQAREDGYHRAGVVPVFGLPSRRARLRRRTPGPDRVVELEIVARATDSPLMRRLLISYQRSLGTLYEVLLLCFALCPSDEHAFLAWDGDAGAPCWGSARSGRAPIGARNEWTASIRDALTEAAGRLTYRHGDRLGVRFDIRVVRLHAPERVTAEPRVVYGEGAPKHPFGRGPLTCQETVDAANTFLERLH